MGAAESNPEQDPRYLEVQRELQRRNEELDIRERELRREMDRREQEIDRRERELRREMDRREQEIDRRERELKRKEEEIDRRETERIRELKRRERELMREMAIREEEMARTKREERIELMREMARTKREERIELMRGMARTKREEDRRELMRGMARREEEMVGHCERRSVPAVLDLSQILSDETQLTDESSEDDFIEPWISFKELRRNLEKDEKAEEMCGRQWMTVKMGAAESYPQPPRSLSEERKKEMERREEEIDRRETEWRRELKRRERELMRENARRMEEMARREEEMVGHCERQSVPAVLDLPQINSDESPEDDFSEPWISFKEPRDLATGKMQQCNSDDLGLSQPSVKMEAAESYPQPPRSPSEERKRELQRRKEMDRRERELDKRKEEFEREREMDRRDGQLYRREEEMDINEKRKPFFRRIEEVRARQARKGLSASVVLPQINSDESPVNHFSDPWISFEELRINLEKDEKAEEMCGRQWMTVKMGAAESHPQPPKSLYEERKRELQRRKEEMDRRYGLYRREEEMDRNEKRKKKFQIIKEVRARQARKGLPASVVPSQIHSDQSSKDDFSKPRISFKEPRDLATGKMQQCSSDDLGLSQPSVKMEAAESHPEQDPRYLEMQRELQRRNEESDIRERELRREMDRREQEIDRRERELRRELDIRERELRREMDRREQEIDRRERELKRKEEEIDRRESELMREMARRKEEMVGHCERKSVPAVLGLSQIHSDESPEDDFSDPWISFKELRINLEKDEEAEEMCGRQWMTSHPEPPRSPSEERKRELERRERELMREMARRKEEMVGHCERQSVPAVLGLSQIHSDESSECDFSEPWIFVNPVRRNSKELTPPYMSESEDNPLDGL